jgi:hypothetical protein
MRPKSDKMRDETSTLHIGRCVANQPLGDQTVMFGELQIA